jgi:hypothetical protein
VETTKPARIWKQADKLFINCSNGRDEPPNALAINRRVSEPTPVAWFFLETTKGFTKHLPMRRGLSKMGWIKQQTPGGGSVSEPAWPLLGEWVSCSSPFNDYMPRRCAVLVRPMSSNFSVEQWIFLYHPRRAVSEGPCRCEKLVVGQTLEVSHQRPHGTLPLTAPAAQRFIWCSDNQGITH